MVVEGCFLQTQVPHSEIFSNFLTTWLSFKAAPKDIGFFFMHYILIKKFYIENQGKKEHLRQVEEKEDVDHQKLRITVFCTFRVFHS